jgi:hypothetical protein
MIRGIYAPSDFVSKDRGPGVSTEEKLRIISSSPVQIEPELLRGKVRMDDVVATLPFVDGGIFAFGLPSFPETILSDHINVGQAELYGHGIGSRLLRAGLRYAVEQDPTVCEFHTGWARLGLINAVVSVLGEDNVGVSIYGDRFGWGTQLPLEAMFDAHPPVEGKKYLVNNIAAKVDRDLALTWEEPRIVLPTDKLVP